MAKLTPAQRKKKVTLLSNTTKAERDRAEKRIAANKKKALALVKKKPKAKARKSSRNNRIEAELKRQLG